jgi:hypothetical protein
MAPVRDGGDRSDCPNILKSRAQSSGWLGIRATSEQPQDPFPGIRERPPRSLPVHANWAETQRINQFGVYGEFAVRSALPPRCTIRSIRDYFVLELSRDDDLGAEFSEIRHQIAHDGQHCFVAYLRVSINFGGYRPL